MQFTQLLPEFRETAHLHVSREVTVVFSRQLRSLMGFKGKITVDLHRKVWQLLTSACINLDIKFGLQPFGMHCLHVRITHTPTCRILQAHRNAVFSVTQTRRRRFHLPRDGFDARLGGVLPNVAWSGLHS